MKFIFLIFILLSVAAAPLAGADGDSSSAAYDEQAFINMKYDRDFLIKQRDSFIKSSGDLPVKDILIKGLKKTSPSVLLSDTGIKVSDLISSFDPHLFINRLKKRNIFSEIDINYAVSEGGAVIEITLEEKWTLIPIPMFSTNRHGTKYGLYVMESNFLGYGKFLFGGGTLSSSGSTAMLGYIDPSIASSRFRGNIFATYKDEVYQSSDIHNNIYSEYMAAKMTARIDIGYTLSDRFRWLASGGYEENRADRSYDKSINSPEDEKAWITGTIARYEGFLHYEYLYYGPKIELFFFQHIPADNQYTEYKTAGYKLDYSFRLYGYDRISIQSNCSTGNRPDIFEEIIGGKPGGKTLPADTITADNFINYTLTYEYPFMRFRWGAITLLAFWEHGIYNNSTTGANRYMGPGAGMMLYLKRIALPAMGFNIAENLNTGLTEFSVNIGMSF